MNRFHIWCYLLYSGLFSHFSGFILAVFRKISTWNYNIFLHFCGRRFWVWRCVGWDARRQRRLVKFHFQKNSFYGFPPKDTFFSCVLCFCNNKKKQKLWVWWYELIFGFGGSKWGLVGVRSVAFLFYFLNGSWTVPLWSSPSIVEWLIGIEWSLFSKGYGRGLPLQCKYSLCGKCRSSTASWGWTFSHRKATLF